MNKDNLFCKVSEVTKIKSDNLNNRHDNKDGYQDDSV